MAAAPQSQSKKRKREIADEGSSADKMLSLQLSKQGAAELGPVLASFPAVRPSGQTPFQCYFHPVGVHDVDRDFAEQRVFVAGETDTVEYSSEWMLPGITAGCRYYVAVHNKRTNTVTMRPAPVQVLTQSVKALKNFQPGPASAADRFAARNALSNTFGTKKAQTRLRAQEKNKVDVSAMEKVAVQLQDTVEKNTATLPTKQEVDEAADDARPIPPHNVDATNPRDVYALNDLIPAAELGAISTTAIIAAGSSRERTALLPHTRSNWVNQHLQLEFAAPTPNKKHIKIIFYIASMMAFRDVVVKSTERETLDARLSRVPEVILSGLLARFTETSRNSTVPRTTSKTQTSLLTHMFALCLHIDDFATDTTLIAKDLGWPSTKAEQLFKSLGCKVKKLTQTELVKLGLPESTAATKRAVLELPLVFPKARTKRRN